MHQVASVVTFVPATVGPHLLTEAFFLVVPEVTLECPTARLLAGAFPMSFVVLKLTLIYPAISKPLETLATSLPSLPLTHVESAIRACVCARAVFSAFFKLTLVLAAIVVTHLADAILHIV